jgi:hypothetical protein
MERGSPPSNKNHPMSHRIGVCSSCDANYKIPSDFASDKAKCKACGGVVEIGAVVEDSPPPPVPAKPVRKAAPKMEEHVPSGKTKGEPTMMERIRAERRAQSAKVGAAAAPKIAPARPKAAAAKPKAAAATRAGSDESKPKAGAGARRGASARRSASKGSSRRRGKDQDEAEEGEEGTGRRSRAKKKSPAPLIATIGLLIIGGIAGAYAVFSGGDEVDAELTTATAEPSTDPTSEEATEAPVEKAEEAPEEEVVEAPKEDKPKVVSKRKDKDPMEVDLDSLADFPKTAGCSDDEWASLQEDAALLIDPLAGAAGGRAGKRLAKAGFAAVPAIINILKKQDFGTEQGQKDGDLIQRKLSEIHNGKNFEWKYTTQPNDNYFNRRVTELWHKTWNKYRGDEAGWLKFTGLDKGGQTASEPENELSFDELDALDDI